MPKSEISIKEDPDFSLLYLHPKINLNHIHENGKLLTDEQIAVIKKALLTNPSSYQSRRVLKNIDPNSDLHANYDVIQMKDSTTKKSRFYVIYQGAKKGKILGEGGFGKVKLAQDLESGEIVVLKVSDTRKNKIPFIEQICLAGNEAKLSTKAGSTALAIGRLQKNKENVTREQALIVMKLFRGEDIYTLSTRKISKAPVEWLTLTHSMLLSMKEVHDKNIYHRDIKPENFIANPLTNTVKVIDFGLAREKPFTKGTIVVGTPGYIAPETYSAGIYSEQTEVYALGCSIVEMLDIGRIYRNTVLLDDAERINDKISDFELRKVIIDFVRRMIDNNPLERPTLAESIRFFEYARDFCLDALSKIKKTGILDANEYMRSSKAERAHLIKALKCCDEVWLVNASAKGSNHSIQKKDYLILRSELEKAGVRLADRLFYSEDTNSSKTPELIRQLPNFIDSKNENIIRTYVYVTHDEENARKIQTSDRIHPLIVSSTKKQHDYANEIVKYQKGNYLTHLEFQFVIDGLIYQADRIKKKYGNQDDRVQKILQTTETLKNNDNLGKTKLTVTELTSVLKGLQSEMAGKSPLRNFLSKWLPISASQAQKEIGEIIEITQRSHNKHGPKR